MIAGTRVATWRSTLLAARDEPAEVLPELVVRFSDEGAAPLPLAEAVLSVWRTGLSSALTELLGVGGMVDLLRAAGYVETPRARASWARFSDLMILAGPGGTQVAFERLHAAAAPAPTRLFRGSRADGGGDGLSWTPSRSVADRYARRRGGRLWTCTPTSDAYLLGTAELLGGRMTDVFRSVPAVTEYLVDPSAIEPEEVRA